MPRYLYGMRHLRGFGPGCQPGKGLISREDDPAGRYNDVLVYDRELEPHEIDSYELDFIGVEPDTTTHESNVVKKGENEGDRTSGDCISRQSEQSVCEYCHEDSDGYVLSVEKNGHAYIQNGKLALRANGWWGECAINFCPMCGRKLRGDKHEID